MKIGSKSWFVATSIAVAAGAAATAGCAAYVGHIRVSALKQQVDEGLSCPASQVTIKCTATRDETEEACGRAEVVGCGHRSTWRVHEDAHSGRWVMTSLDGQRSDDDD